MLQQRARNEKPSAGSTASIPLTAESAPPARNRLASSWILSGVIAGVLALSSSSGRAADAPAQAQRQYDIPPGALDSALRTFAGQANVMLSADASLTAGKSSTSLKGAYSIAQGFEVLLAGSGLQMAEVEAGSYSLRQAASSPIATAADQSTNARTLGKIQVQAEDSTEGYRSDSVSSIGPLGSRSLQDTPYSITVIPSSLIEDQQARSLKDVVRNDASVTSDRSYTYTQLFVRGLYLSTIGGNYRKDGLPIVSITDNVGLEAIERVELLKGLAGFMYGFVSPGGTVNYVLKRPTEVPLFKMTFGMSNDSLLYGAGDYSTRFGSDEALGLRINLATEDGDRPIDRTEMTRYMGALAFDWQVTPDTLLSLDYYRQKNRDHGFNGRIEVRANVSVIPSAPDAERLYGQPWPSYTTTDENFGLRLQHDFNSIVSVKLAWNRYETDFDYQFVGNRLNSDGSTYTVRFLRDPSRGWLADSLQTLVNLNLKTGAIEHRITSGVDYIDVVGQFESIAGYPVILGTSSFSNPVYFAQPSLPATRSPRYESFSQTERSLLLSDEMSIGDHWQIIAGLRRSNFEAGENRSQVGSQIDTIYDKTATTPSIGLIYKPIPHLSLYTSYVEALEQGGTAPVGTVNELEIQPPLTSKQWELGAKFAPNERLSVTTAVFRINKALQFTDTTSNRYVQDGKQTHKGFEVAAFGEVTPGLNVVSSYTWVDAIARDTGDAAVNGKRVTNVPKHQAALYASYSLPGTSGLATINAGTYYSGGRAVNASNTQTIPSWIRYDAGLRYDPSWGNYHPTLRLNVENLTNKNYWESAPFSALSLGVPRTYKFTMEIPF